MDCEIGNWLRLRPMQPNEELADEAYEAGAAAAEAGLSLSDNPYNKFDDAYLHNTWRNGYVENAQEATEG